MIRNIIADASLRKMVTTVVEELKGRSARSSKSHMVFYEKGLNTLNLDTLSNNPSKSFLNIESDDANDGVVRILAKYVIDKLYPDNGVSVVINNETGNMEVTKPFFRSFRKIKGQITQFLTDMQPENRVKTPITPAAKLVCMDGPDMDLGTKTVEEYPDHVIKIIDSFI